MYIIQQKIKLVFNKSSLFCLWQILVHDIPVFSLIHEHFHLSCHFLHCPVGKGVQESSCACVWHPGIIPPQSQGSLSLHLGLYSIKITWFPRILQKIFPTLVFSFPNWTVLYLQLSLWIALVNIFNYKLTKIKTIFLKNPNLIVSFWTKNYSGIKCFAVVLPASLLNKRKNFLDLLKGNILWLGHQQAHIYVFNY